MKLFSTTTAVFTSEVLLSISERYTKNFAEAAITKSCLKPKIVKGELQDNSIMVCQKISDNLAIEAEALNSESSSDFNYLTS